MPRLLRACAFAVATGAALELISRLAPAPGPLWGALALALFALEFVAALLVYDAALDHLRNRHRIPLRRLRAGSMILGLALHGLPFRLVLGERALAVGPAELLFPLATIATVAPLGAWAIDGLMAATRRWGRRGPLYAFAGFSLAIAVLALVLFEWIRPPQSALADPFDRIAAPALCGSVTLIVIAAMAIAFSRRWEESSGSSLAGYQLVRRLAAGGMGELYLATRTGPHGFERPVALKRIISAVPDEVQIERFLSEARLAASLVHPNIVAVHDLGRFRDGWFIAMELLSGASLAQVRDASRRAGRPVPAELLAEVGEQVCRGLAYAHERGIVHRDISPQNVMITYEGAVKIVDFGIAKARPRGPDTPASTPVSADLTADGMVMGKPAYMAPEQLQGGEIGPPADQYALAVVLHELATGTRPVEGDPRPLLAIRPDLPPELCRAIARARAEHPMNRFASAAEMGQTMRSVRVALPPFDLGEWLRALLPSEPEAPALPATVVLPKVL